jgi:hypothetical protein
MEILKTDYIGKTETSTTSVQTPKTDSSSSTSFKDELSAAKTQNSPEDKKTEATTKSEKDTVKDQVKEDKKADNQPQINNNNNNVNDKVQPNSDADAKKASSDNTKSKSKLDKIAIDSTKELNEKIQTINEIKQNTNKFSTNSINKTSKKISDIKKDDKSIKMDMNDAKFFINLVNSTDNQYSIQANGNLKSTLINQNTDIQNNQNVSQVVNVSSALMTQLQNSMETNKPFRIDFDNNIAVIMKVDKQGKLSADFIPGDRAVEAYLKANLPMLQQTMETQNLPYSNLSYRQSKQDNGSKNNNNQQNKEDNNE